MKDENLIFIISQPRSGSTFLQKVMSNHPEVATASEPWLLFPFALFTRPDLYKACYNEKVAYSALIDFLSKFDVEEELNRALKSTLVELYSRASNNSRYFLDKTPRYYEVLPQLVSWFPNARYVILKRNPLAVVCSMIDTWCGGEINYRRLLSFERDFLEAPKVIQEFSNSYKYRKNVYEIQYETFVEKPRQESEKLFDWLNLEFEGDMLQFDKNKKVEGRFGDDVYDVERDAAYKAGPVVASVDKWMNSISKKNYRTFLNGYYNFLGENFFRSYGYPLDKITLQLLKDVTTEFDKYMFLKANRSKLDIKTIDFIKYKILKLFRY